jgi:hypothetical protein
MVNGARMIPGFDLRALHHVRSCEVVISYATPGDLPKGVERTTTIGEVATHLLSLLERRPAWKPIFEAWQRQWHDVGGGIADPQERTRRIWQRVAAAVVSVSEHPVGHDLDLADPDVHDGWAADGACGSSEGGEVTGGDVDLHGVRLAAGIALADLHVAPEGQGAGLVPGVPRWVWLTLADPGRSADPRDAVGLQAGLDELVMVLHPAFCGEDERQAHNALLRLWRLADEPQLRWTTRGVVGMEPLLTPLRGWGIAVGATGELAGLHRQLKAARAALPRQCNLAAVELYGVLMGLAREGIRKESTERALAAWTQGPVARAWAARAKDLSPEAVDRVEDALDDLVERLK